MRIAIVSDIHGNRTAFEAVLADLREAAPDLTLHGGDLALGGAGPAEIVDQIRDLGWRGVLGNVDEMLPKPETFAEFASRSPEREGYWKRVEETAAATREILGTERMAWLGSLPLVVRHERLALVHASPETTWHSPEADASGAEFESVYNSLGAPTVVYGHIHKPFVRRIAEMTVANAGSVSLSFDGNWRAAYLLIDDDRPEIRRVEYDLDREMKAIAQSSIPYAACAVSGKTV
jgi:putative phosphoesterase